MKRIGLILVALAWLAFMAALTCRADAVQDVREWPSNGLPIVTNWNTGGFVFDWHVDQVRAGNRFLPTTKINLLSTVSPKEKGLPLTAQNEAFLRDSKLPMCLRTDNVCQILTGLERQPIALESIPRSPVVWTIKNGVLNDEGIADPFADPAIWHAAGVDWGRSGMPRDMERRFPDAPYFILADNNEAAVDSMDRYLVDTTRNEFDDFNKAFKPVATLETLSLRMRDYVASGKTVDDLRHDWPVMGAAQFNALFDGFDSSLGPWKGKMLTEGYKLGAFSNLGTTQYTNQYTPSYNWYNGGSGPLYVSANVLSNFTSADWFKVYYSSPINLKAETLDPKHFRQCFINFTDGGMWGASSRGEHAVMNRERIAAWTQWLVWSMCGDGKGINVRWWVGNASTPKTPLCGSDQSKANFIAGGCTELTTATLDLPINAVMDGVNLIASNPVLRMFCQRGKPVQTGTHPGNEIRQKVANSRRTFPQPGDRDEGFRLLMCDLNTDRSEWVREPKVNQPGGWGKVVIKVWGTATELNGDVLVHLWTPCVFPADQMCRLTVPNIGDVQLPIPPPEGSYHVWRKGTVFSLDAYAREIAKTPFDIWLESRPDLAGESVDVLRVIFKVNNPPTER